ncbi:Protein of unknown function [Lactobacillus acidophilus DSM 9126]|nr:Protein of unknown function [Lactobacillus acidophilus DSM 9126]
MLFYKVQITD